ncbi:hypothetical protein MKZ38_002707 [Zalerion maritima]|uniref:Uncharacterized protein n=1 Tax=Zalerion maritima TaxID=339359 RepID=A0AAD5RPV7_9PEZI|nr:hypothetical protein MKZ38_002707 [Zalerion maritima]
MLGTNRPGALPVGVDEVGPAPVPRSTTTSSRLLSIPAEILEEIIYWSVHPQYRMLQRALRLRLVCKTIEPLVTRALHRIPSMSREAMSRVKSPRVKKFTTEESDFWAELHMRQMHRRSRLPMYKSIAKLVDSYCHISNITDEEDKTRILLDACRPQYMAFYAPRMSGFESVYPFGLALQVDHTDWENEIVQTRGLLAMCCLFNNRTLLEGILRKQPDHDRGGQEYLIRLAARSGHAEIVQTLFDMQYAINKPKLAYLLCEAAMSGSTEVLDVIQNSSLEMPLGWRTCTPPWPLTGVGSPEFLEHYLKSDLYDSEGQKPEEYTRRFRERIAIWCAADNEVEVLRYLVEKYGISDVNRDLAIKEAAQGYATEAVRYLLGNRPLEAERWSNMELPPLATALKSAVKNGSFFMSKMLLEHHESTHGFGCVLSVSGTNELFVYAVQKEHVELLRLLLTYVKVSDGDWALMMTEAEREGLESMKEVIVEEREKHKGLRVVLMDEARRVERDLQVARLMKVSSYLAVPLVVGVASWVLSRRAYPRSPISQFSRLLLPAASS